MGTRWLENFFEPSKIAVIGASERTSNMGGAVIQNLKASAFKGSLYALNVRRYKTVHGVPCMAKIGRLPKDVDLAIICTPNHTIEKIIKQLGRHGVRAIMILTGGISRQRSEQYDLTRHALKQLAREYGIRIMGPDSLGILVPELNLNASYSHINALPGKVAYLGQSGTLASAMLDWAYGRGIGFSHFLTIGNSADVSMPDAIDYLSSKRDVKAIMLHIERITDAPSFVRAVRNAARGKLVLAIKSSRFPQSQIPLESIPSGLRHKDMVYDAILLRAGVLRVDSSEELFESVESLTRMKPFKGERLAVVGNGTGGPLLAVDRLMHEGGQLAQLSQSTLDQLAAVLPDYWSPANPMDITPEAGPAAYKQVLQIIEQDPGVDAMLVLFSPISLVNSQEVANVVANHSKLNRKNLLTSWMGGATVARSRHLFDDFGIPTYDTPDRAIKAYMGMVRHQRNQALLRETPASLLQDVAVDREACRGIIGNALNHGRDYLTAQESHQIICHYGFNTVETDFFAETLDASNLEVKYPAAIKVIHQDYCHPFAYGDNPRGRWRGVITGINDEHELLLASKELGAQIRQRFAKSRVHGYGVQPMHTGEISVQFSMGITRDDTFGPLILFGGGGAAANVMADRAVQFPPLNDVLACQLMNKTHIFRVLTERSHDLAGDVAQLAKMLTSLSQMAVDLPNLKGCELNVILHATQGLKVLGVAMDLGAEHSLCIRPYPVELEELGHFKDHKTLTLRPVRGEDEPALKRFHEVLSAESLRYRFFTARRHFRHSELARFAQIDYQQEMAFVATDDASQILGVVRTWTDADRVQSEFSLLVAGDAQGIGLGSALMQKMIAYCKQQGVMEMMGTILTDNGLMLQLAKKLGFTVRRSDDDTVEVVLRLNDASEEWQKLRLKRLNEGKK